MRANGRVDCRATTNREPWEADPTWHPARREAFEAYRDMPERSLSALARGLHKSKQLLGRWSREDGWVDRCAAWDAECDRRRREEFMDAGTDAARAQAMDAAELRAALMAPARALRARIERMRAEDGGEPFQDLSLAELMRLTAAAGHVFAPVAQAERAALGLTDDHGAPLVPPDIARMTVADLEEYLTGRALARE